MKTHYIARTVLLIWIIIILLGAEVAYTGATGSSTYVDQGADEETTHFGVNYLSAYNHYEPRYLSDEILERDFGLFRNQGLEYVTLVAVWKYLEPQLGAYNDTAIDELIRVCDFASRYNLRVTIDFYTLMKNNSWTMPVWLSPRKFETIFTDKTGTARQAWLDFLGHCASRLNSSESIWSWHMMNEPARKSWGCNVPIEDFLQLWADMKEIFRSYSNRPVSIRFTPQVFDDPNHFNRDPRIYDVCDYISLNWYEVYCSRELFSDVVEDVSAHTKVIVSEFGTNVTDDHAQADLYRQYVDLFHSLGIRDCIAWMWRADNSSTSNPEGPIEDEQLRWINGTYDLAKNWDGEPRTAFYLLRDDSATQAHLVVRGAHDEIFYRLYNCTISSWENWRVIPYGATCDSPAGAVYSGKLYFVVRGMDYQGLWFGAVNLTDYGFSGWTRLSGASPSAPTLVCYGSKLVLVARGFTNVIYYRSYDCVSETWTEWVPVPNGATCDNPAAAVLGSSLHLVVRGFSTTGVWGNNTLWHGIVNLGDDSFSGWTSLPGATPSAPALAASQTSGNLSLTVRGMSDVIWVNNWSSEAWQGWNALPSGATCDSPAATVVSGELHIVVRSMTGDALWHYYIDLDPSVPSGWIAMDGYTPSAPTLGS